MSKSFTNLYARKNMYNAGKTSGVLRGGASKRIGKSLGLKTEVYETLNLVSVSCKILNHGWFYSWSCFLWKIIESPGLCLNMILNQVSSSPDVIF